MNLKINFLVNHLGYKISENWEKFQPSHTQTASLINETLQMKLYLQVSFLTLLLETVQSESRSGGVQLVNVNSS